MKKICLIGASFETKNMGVSALTSGLINVFSNGNEKVSITILDFGTNKWLTRISEYNGNPVDLFNLRFNHKIFLPNNIIHIILLAVLYRLSPFSFLKNLIKSSNRYFNEILTMDYFGAISAGDSLASIYGINQFLYITLPMIIVVLARKKLVLLPQTYGPFNGFFYKAMAKLITRNSEKILSRDLQGKETIMALLSEKHYNKIDTCYDVAFLLETEKPADENRIVELFNTKKIKIGLNISGLLWIGGYNRKNMFNLTDDYQITLNKLISWVLQETDADLYLIPHVFGDEKSIESDISACKTILSDFSTRYTGRIKLVEGNFNHSQIKYVISLCDFFMGSRMHACIAALSQNIPAISLAYSDKFIGVMEMLEISDLVVDLRKKRMNNVIAIVDEQFKRRMDIRTKLIHKNKVIRADIHKKIWETVFF